MPFDTVPKLIQASLVGFGPGIRQEGHVIGEERDAVQGCTVLRKGRKDNGFH